MACMNMILIRTLKDNMNFDVLTRSSNCNHQRGRKTENRYKGYNGVCFSHGYNVAPDHDSKTCRPHTHKPGHDESHTGDNPVNGALQKDKKFSKQAGQPLVE